eukprot:5541015-Amphidinium_carterae.1
MFTQTFFVAMLSLHPQNHLMIMEQTRRSKTSEGQQIRPEEYLPKGYFLTHLLALVPVDTPEMYTLQP